MDDIFYEDVPVTMVTVLPARLSNGKPLAESENLPRSAGLLD
eukprot:CAMPEP_0177640112 /NCGR_PEP_ID=MMETSP0447-20121125/6373_1 /TAXON_ID=0 /ORGANISM="Stygamoeba regulata, Strain BSH-02190019" /LENGTH=41 /DNA_ID= /DNA_START= /DNA_END= /DNA_ORIENTATION=